MKDENVLSAALVAASPLQNSGVEFKPTRLKKRLLMNTATAEEDSFNN